MNDNNNNNNGGDEDIEIDVKVADNKLQGILLYIRNMYKQLWFPSISEDGEVFVTSGVGRASKTNRKVLQGSTLERHIDQYFPQGHIHYLNSPQNRANKHKPANQTQIKVVAGQMVRTTEESPWTEATMKLAAREFEVPAGTQFVLVMPEIFHREILKKYDRYRCGKANNGIKTPCPR